MTPHNDHTPYLLMDLDAVARCYEQFQTNFPGVDIHYAMKCNPDVAILRTIKDRGGSFEIASLNELELLHGLGVKPRDVLFSNPVKMEAHIKQAAKAGLYRFSFDSLHELEKIAANAPGSSVYVRIATVPADTLVPSEGKFGITLEHAAELMVAARQLGLTPYGITFHVGSQMHEPRSWDIAIKNSARLMRLLREHDITLDMLDMGGGFPAAYQDESVDLSTYADTIFAALAEHLPYELKKLAIEPGRGLVANAGTMISKVIGTAERHGKKWVHLDVGAFNGMMEALETQNTLRFPMTDSKKAARQQTYTVTGPSCDSQDTILSGVVLSEGLRSGDFVFIGAAGAYTTSYASNFNGFDIPKTFIKQ